MNRDNPENLALAVHANVDGALERLIRDHQDQLYGYALRLLRNSCDAQEVTQDAFVGAYRALALRYDAERCRTLALRPWLFRIVRNLAFNRLRARRAAPEEPLESCTGAGIQSGGPGPGREAESLFDSELLGRALAGMKPSARELIVLRFVEDLPYAEIAGILGTSEASARGKVFRALQQLKALFRKPGFSAEPRGRAGLKEARVFKE